MVRIVGLILFNILSYISYAQEIKWFNPWNNRLGNLEESIDALPVIYNGSNYRIVKIEGFVGSRILDINVKSNKVTIEIYQLPNIADHKGRRILDLMLPVNYNETLYDPAITKYFLLKFNGVNRGSEIINLVIKTNKGEYKLDRKIHVSNPVNVNNLHLNVWGYFDYDFLVEGVKSKMIKDLVDHGSDVLIIPPGYFPAIGNIQSERISKLRQYLQGTKGKFKYYILYFGYSQSSNHVLGKGWKTGFNLWYSTINKVFIDSGIPLSKIVFYPYDEPKSNSINSLLEMHRWVRSNGVKTPFFVTIGSEEAAKVAKTIELVQVYSGRENLVKKVNSMRGNNTDIWIYEIPAGSRNYEATFYQRVGIKAFLYNAEGIGVWNYSDVRKAFNSGKVSIARGKGSWELMADNPVRDYSLIYRKGNQIYSSLRWEALRYGKEDYKFLNIYLKKYGASKTDYLIKQLLSGKINNNEWERIKVLLIK